MEVEGGIAPALLHRHGGEAGDLLRRQAADGLVAAEEKGGHPHLGGVQGIEGELGGDAAVDLQAADDVFVDGVGQGAAVGAGGGVVADVEGAGIASVHTGHHGAGVTGPAPHEPHAPGQLVVQEVPSAVVAVPDHRLVAGGQDGLAGRRHLPGHLEPGLLVALAARLGLAPGGDVGDPLQVGADEVDCHRIAPFNRRTGPRSPGGPGSSCPGCPWWSRHGRGS